MKRIAIGLLCAVALSVTGLGAYQFHRQTMCSNMETDYLNTVGQFRTASYGKALAAQRGQTTKYSDMATDLSTKVSMGELRDIYDTCGQRAGDSAARKAGEMLF